MSKVNRAIEDPNVGIEACYAAQNEVYGGFDYPLLSDLIRGNGVERILDIGTGDGSFVAGLAEKHPDVIVDAIDLNENLVQSAKNAYAALARRIDYRHATFDRNFPGTGYDLIMARFAVEHISDPEDIDEFMAVAHDKLKPNGWLVIIEYYIHDLDIDDEIWKEFRARELAVYRKYGVHTRIALRLPQSLRKVGFYHIKSSINHISRSIVGDHPFFNLLEEYAKLYADVDSEIWPEEITNAVIAWCRNVGYDVDPVLFTSHTLAQRL